MDSLKPVCAFGILPFIFFSLSFFFLILNKRRGKSHGHAETASEVSENHRGCAQPTGHAPSQEKSQLKVRPPLLGPLGGGSRALQSEDPGFSQLNPRPLPPFPSGCSALVWAAGREREVCGERHTPGQVLSSDFRPTWENFT